METVCRTCGETFTLSEAELASYARFGFDPVPECFTCIQKHHLGFRNGRILYARSCDATGKRIISNYASDSPFTVYEREYWMSDAWDSLSYGKAIDWNRSFFEQFRELHRSVPRIALFNVDPENSEYCNMCVGNKNCYLVFGGDYNEETLYGTLCMRNRDCIDCDYSNENELCYWMMNSFSCYGSRFLYDCKNCTSSAFLSDCIGCKDCILCSGLTQKQYCIGNVQLTREEYEERKEAYFGGSYPRQVEHLTAFSAMRSGRAVKNMHAIGCTDCNGDYLENSKNCKNCYFTWSSEDCGNCVLLITANDCFQSGFTGHHSQRCYHSQALVNGVDCKFCFGIVDSYDAQYCDTILHCKHCFGCTGLQHKEYCILNRQYTKQEYETLVPHIIEKMKADGEWNQFFPKDCSCFAYNESTAMEYWPLSKEQALAEGYQWKDSPGDRPQSDRLINATDLPDAIEDTPDEVLSWGIRCSETGRHFKIVKQELAFYRQWHIPLPRLHPDVRYRHRMESVNPFLLHVRTCHKCGKTIETTYAPERPEIVYCESCYLAAFY